MNPEELNSYLKKQQEKGLDTVGIWQVRIAANMGLPAEKLDYIALPDLSFSNREWLYIAMLEGIPLERLASLATVTSQSIIDLRRTFFQEEYAREPEYIKELTVIRDEVKEQLQESRALCGFLQEQGEVRRKETEELREAVQQKEAEIRGFMEKNVTLAKELENVQKENTSLRDVLVMLQENTGKKTVNDIPSESGMEASGSEAEADSSQTEKDDKDVTDLEAGCGAGEKRRLFFWQRMAEKICIRKKQRMDNRENEEFIIMLQKIKFSPDQKYYLLKCREEGDSLEVLRNIAFEAFDVPTMERIRKLLKGGDKPERREG